MTLSLPPGVSDPPPYLRKPRALLNVLVAVLILTLLLSACAPGSVARDSFRIAPSPNFRPVTVREAAKAFEYAELEFALASPGQGEEVTLSPLSGLILPAYRHVIPELRFRASGSSVSEDASYRQIYSWGLYPLRFDGLRPGDLVFYSDGTGPVTDVGLFAGWEESERRFRMLVGDRATGSASYLEWDLGDAEQDRRLVAVGRLFVAAPQTF